MAKTVLKKAYIELATTDRSTWFRSMGLNRSAADLVATTFGTDDVQREGGLRDNNLQLEGLHPDADEVNAAFFALVGTKVAFKVRRDSASGISATNPSYEGSAVLTDYNVVNGAVGELSSFTFNLAVDGAVTRATS